MRRAYWTRAAERAVHERYRRLLDTWNTEHREHRIPTSLGETFVISAGNPGLPTVVLLPGSMATSAMWMRTLPALADRFHVLAVDIVGDAGFSAPSRPSMRSDAHARWLDDILEALVKGTTNLVGASFGGWLALDYAIRRPARVHRLVLLSPAGVGRIRPRFVLKTAPYLFLGPWGHRKALAFDMGFGHRERSADESAFVDLFDAVRSGFIARLQPIPTFPNRALAGLHMPVLAVVGSDDKVFDSAETQARIEANIRRSKVLMLHGVGHALPDSTLEIREFLIRA